MKKVVIIHNIISPHVTPLLKEIAKKVDLTVLYCAEKEENRRWKEKPEGFEYKVLKNSSFKVKGKDLSTYFFNPSVIGELKFLKPDIVVVSGWDQLAYYAAYLYCKFTGVKFVIWSGSTEHEKTFGRFLTKGLVKILIKGADSYIAYGSRAKKYLTFLGANQKKIYVSYNTTDIEKYAKLTQSFKADIVKNKKDLGLNDKKIILYYGQLIDRKGIKYLLEAFREINQSVSKCALLIVGSGDYKKKLEENKISNLQILSDPGDEEVCKYFALADVFVLPSKQEVWGLVVNEAMAAGLPVIISDKAGSSVDLVKNGSNGYIFHSGNIKELTTKIKQIISSPDLQSKMSKNSQKIIRKFDPKITSKEFLKALS